MSRVGIISFMVPALVPHRAKAIAFVAAAALAFSGLGTSAAAGTRERTVPGSGLIAFRDASGIGVLDPADGQQRMLLTVPPGCGPAAGGVGGTGLAGPVWAPASGLGSRLYFWVTDWQYKPTPACDLPQVPSWVGAGGAVLVQADPFNGNLRALAAAPAGMPCQPGEDLVALAGALAFTNGGCDEPQVEALGLPLRPGAQPVGAALAVPAQRFASHCAVSERLLGEGPHGRALLQEVGTQCQPPPPSLQWWGPTANSVGLFSPLPPRGVWDELRASALAPSQRWEAFALGTGGAGTLDLRTGAWSSERLPPCAGPACGGAMSVSFSPSGNEIALADNGDLVVTPVSGGGRPRVLLAGGVASASWSGPMKPEMPTAGPVPALAGELASLWAAFSRFWGVGERATWRVLPAAMPAPAVSVVSLPEPASSLLMLSGQVVLAAGTEARDAGSWWRSTDGGRTWEPLNPHCAAGQGAAPNFLPCQVSRMAALPGGVALARGDAGLGLWRSTDEGLRWQREPFEESRVEGGPWVAGTTAYLLVEAAQANGQPVATAASFSLLASTDQGRTWHEIMAVPRDDPGNAPAALARFFVLGSGRFAELYRAGDCSLPADLRLSTDAGRSWFDAPPARLVTPGALGQATPSRLVLGASYCGSAAPGYGEGLYLHSFAPGGPWAAAHLPSGYRDLYGLGATGRFPVSAPLVTPFSVAAVAFPGAGEGVAVGSAVSTVTNSSGVPAGGPSQGSDLIFVSRNGGVSWTDQSVPGAPALSELTCAGPGRCLAAG